MPASTVLRPDPTLLFLMIGALMGLSPAVAQGQEDDLKFRSHSKSLGNEGVNWSTQYCEDKDECDIQIRIRNGERIVIVNGDTVETDKLFDDDDFLGMHRYKPLLDDFRDRITIDDPAIHGFAFFGDDDWIGLLEDGTLPRVRDFDFDFTFATDEILMKMERRARELAQKAERAEGSERAALEDELEKKLGEIFDYKSDRRRRTIESTEKKLSDMQERFQRRESARDEIIDRRKEELLGEESHMEW
jgi:hypothetical protein